MRDWINEICGAFMPHGQCYLWEPALVWLHAISDGLVGLSYYSIPLALLYFIRKRRDVPFPGIFLMFGAFIVACGTTHLMEVWTIWHPTYWLSGGLKLVTALISVATAVVLVRILPLALALPSAERLREMNRDLDLRVRERTSELSASNARLESEMAQRRKAEEEVRELNARLRRRIEELQALFNLIPIGIAISENPECRQVRCNRRLSEMLGVPADEDLATSVAAESAAGSTALPFDLWRGERRLVPEEQPMRLAVATNTPVLGLDETLRRADGVRLELVVNAEPLRDEAGNARGCVATFADVTRLREQAREKLELERRMFETQRMEGLGVLAGGVAHDFNNLLAGIVGNIGIARLELSPSQRNALEVLLNAERAGLRASDLCKQLLAYAGEGLFVIQALRLEALVEDATRLLEVSLSRRISLEKRLERGLPEFQGDATQIRQVLINLMLNAAEAIGDRTGRITITTGRATVTAEAPYRLGTKDGLSPGDYVMLELADDGCGMTPEVMARIFDPFFTTKFTGRGLGLAAVLGILRGHKAGISVSSEPGKGTTFRVYFLADPGEAGVP